MRKSGGILLIIGIVLISLIILGVGAAVYFYNFHVFKEIRLCLGEEHDTTISCEVRDNCMEVLGDLNLDTEEMPNFIKEKVDEVLSKALYCDGSCMVRDLRGINLETNELEMLESCNSGEEEIVIEIRGKEGLEIWKYLKSRENQ
jgi:hypothetical protein